MCFDHSEHNKLGYEYLINFESFQFMYPTPGLLL